MTAITYKDAGVDLELYEQSMSRLPRLMRRTHSPRVLNLESGFAGLFELDFASPLFARRYENPVLVGCKDGVGTKLNVAKMVGDHSTVGIDLVAMCVNDAICCGAEPLFFMDYLAMSCDDPPLVEQLVQGVSDGCVDSDCALLGGETAIMPDLYRDGDYDMSGTCVGVVERKRVIDGKAVSPGDVVIGIASNGVHSNGFSLIRKIVFDAAGLSVDQPFPNSNHTIGEELMRPTQIYTRAMRRVQTHYQVKQVVHGVAHITGGGLHENISRILPPGARVEIERGSWDVPPVFPWMQQLGSVADEEMARVFNMGIGLAVIVAEYYAANVRKLIESCGLKTAIIGRVFEGDSTVTWAE